ncbi:hypothetical protein BC941DRAFT_330431, partial [Chlamydoabsidia padenii]
LPFFYRSLRVGPLCAPHTILGRIFQAFDGYDYRAADIQLSSGTCLRLPIAQIATLLSPDHWLNKKHRNDLVNFF